MCDLKWYLFCSTEYYQATGEREGAIGRSESEPGSLGQMDGSGEEYSASGGYGSSFEDEPPLLQELGIDFELIKQKVRARQKGRMFVNTCVFLVQTLSVLNPFQQSDVRLSSDTDLAGPLLFCLLFGVVLLLVCVCVPCVCVYVSKVVHQHVH